MSAWIDDLSPFFADRCWMFVLLAKQAPVGVILRRGPTKWWHVTLWDTERDEFQSGQWFRGSMYPAKCDISPDGNLFIYFAGKFRAQQIDYTWIAVSRPPYLTALALWPVGDTWGGHGLFVDNRTVCIGTSGDHDRSHPPGPLRVKGFSEIGHEVVPSWRHGWRPLFAKDAPKQPIAWRRQQGSLLLEREMETFYSPFPSSRPRLFTLYRQENPICLFEAHWADWDQQGRLVATVGGRVLEGKLRRDELVWRELAALQDEKPERMEAPGWAQTWFERAPRRVSSRRKQSKQPRRTS